MLVILHVEENASTPSLVSIHLPSNTSPTSLIAESSDFALIQPDDSRRRDAVPNQPWNKAARHEG